MFVGKMFPGQKSRQMLPSYSFWSPKRHQISCTPNIGFLGYVGADLRWGAGWVGGRLVKCDFRSHSGSHQSSAWIQNPSWSQVWQKINGEYLIGSRHFNLNFLVCWHTYKTFLIWVPKFFVQKMWVQKNNGLKNVESKRILVKKFASTRVRENFVVVYKDYYIRWGQTW